MYELVIYRGNQCDEKYYSCYQTALQAFFRWKVKMGLETQQVAQDDCEQLYCEENKSVKKLLLLRPYAPK